MKTTATKTAKTVEENQNQPTFLSRITNTFNRLGKLDFDGRKKILQILNQVKDSEKDAELRSFIIQLKSIFFDKHLKLTVDSIREKYQIIGKPTQKDFYRICEGEKISIVNDETAPNVPKISVGCYFTIPDLEERYYINLDEKLKGKERLRSQFHFLGNHFLHRGEMQAIPQAFGESETRNTQVYEARLFAIYFLDFNFNGHKNEK